MPVMICSKVSFIYRVALVKEAKPALKFQQKTFYIAQMCAE